MAGFDIHIYNQLIELNDGGWKLEVGNRLLRASGFRLPDRQFIFVNKLKPLIF